MERYRKHCGKSVRKQAYPYHQPERRRLPSYPLSIAVMIGSSALERSKTIALVREKASMRHECCVEKACLMGPDHLADFDA